MLKTDSKLLGFLVGMVLPILGIFVFWGGAYGASGLRDMGILLQELDKLSAVISIGLLANLPAFFLFYRFQKDESARGVIMATFVYALVIVIIKFVL
jgi:mannitol-specific phosphotransferase system IIBC component